MRLYSANTIKSINISVDLGHYNLYSTGNGTDELIEDMIGEGRSVILRPEGKKIHVSFNETDYGTFTGLRRQAVEKQNNINAKSGKENSDVAKSYATFLKGYNIVMGTDSKEGIKRINELIAIEDKCLDFLSYRQTITDNNAKILAKSKECKNIVSVYSNYMKTADKEWTKEATNAKLQTIISNQDKILMALNSANAKEKDNAVKLAKDKGIENMLKIIQ